MVLKSLQRVWIWLKLFSLQIYFGSDCQASFQHVICGESLTQQVYLILISLRCCCQPIGIRYCKIRALTFIQFKATFTIHKTRVTKARQ